MLTRRHVILGASTALTASGLVTLGWDDEAVYALLQKGDTVGVFHSRTEVGALLL